jgi:hypothetical protein
MPSNDVWHCIKYCSFGELSNHTFSIDTLQREIVEQLMNDELQRIWKDAVMAYMRLHLK